MLQVVMPALAVIVLDQATKRWIHAQPERDVALGSIVRIHCVVNRNRIYQQAGTRLALAALWLVALASAAVLYLHGLYFQGSLGLPGLALAFGGSASNLADILRRRSIVDFIDLGWWPAFNVADIAIVAGLAAALYP
ncbi:MAG TPA: signal peptidase II [Vicinamibacterales bacterium]|jgi:signal peptidase II|nr:signal peptidase II [Vicinamibacterales bacterium]